jgi:hypothetical protein
MVEFAKNQKIIGFNGCSSFEKIMTKLKLSTTDKKKVFLDNAKKYIGKIHKGCERKLISPSLVEFGASKEIKVIANGTPEINKYILKLRKKVSVFGNIRLEYAPMPGWGKFSASPGNDRAGNAISCKESGKNMCSTDTSESFPKKKLSLFGKKKKVITTNKSKFGKQLLESVSEKYYTKRGNTGFDNLPNSLYSNDGNQAFSKNFSPYGGHVMSGILPRPYGPRDNAFLRNLAFGRAGDFGPFINQAYNRSNTNAPLAAAFGRAGDFGPFINQAYNRSNTNAPLAAAYGQKKRKSKFGVPLSLENQIGYVHAKPQFRPHSKRNDAAVYQSIGNGDLYLPGYNPFQMNAFGNASLYNSMGPNIQEMPMLVYPVGLGGNTVNYFTNKDYYKEGNKSLKVNRNNNPTGFLSSVKVKPVSGLTLKTQNNLMRAGFGEDKKKDWVMDKKQLSRPITTNLFQNEGAGFQRIAQPLELYSYQNTDAAGFNYPAFLGPRMWEGGYGSNKKKSASPVKRVKYTSDKQPNVKKVKVKTVVKTKNTTKKVKPGDTLQIKNGKVKVVK